MIYDHGWIKPIVILLSVSTCFYFSCCIQLFISKKSFNHYFVFSIRASNSMIFLFYSNLLLLDILFIKNILLRGFKFSSWSRLPTFLFYPCINVFFRSFINFFYFLLLSYIFKRADFLFLNIHTKILFIILVLILNIYLAFILPFVISIFFYQ